jgi:signal transduction histidine kinase
MMNAAAATHAPNEHLIAIVAHELRYPLVPIRNAAALLKQDALDAATIRRAAEIIERQANGMHRLIADLVEVTRMQLGPIELRTARATLDTVLERAIESVAPIAREHGQTLSINRSPEPIYLEVDVLRLASALHNIIGNAFKYTEPHGFIHIRTKRHGCEALIIVSDTGAGIPAADLERIFGLFVQSGPRERIEAGLGIGLYLARHLIEAHHGTVTAASDGRERGSVFTVRLPCEPPTLRSNAQQSDAAQAGDRSPA